MDLHVIPEAIVWLNFMGAPNKVFKSATQVEQQTLRIKIPH